MSLFGVTKDEFESFQSSVLSRLANFESELRQRPSDAEQQARVAANSAKVFEEQVRSSAGTVQAAVQELSQFRNAALQELQALQRERANTTASGEELVQKVTASQAAFSHFIDSKKDVDLQVTDLSQKVAESNALLAQASELPEAFLRTKALLDESKEVADSIKALLLHATSRKSEIDELHKRILGQDIDGDGDKSEHVDGLKDELEKTYRSLSEKAQSLSVFIDNLTASISSKHDYALAERNKKFEEFLSESASRYDSVNEQLMGLLPGSMAAGLSAAYEKKKEEESVSMKEFEKSFKGAIMALVGVSMIPLAVDVYLLAFEGKGLVQVIKDTPNLILAILPIYFPVLWLAYSTSKKLNLSKRLIEEYTHKAVLGKTFSGLSNQIETLSHQSAVKDELRTRLLFNVLQVSAENPGKLITDYNKADHPIMEALENSGKLSDSMDAISKIPGFSAIAKKIAERSEKIVMSQVDRVEKGLIDQVSMVSRVEDSISEVQKG